MLVFLPLMILFITTAVGEMRPGLKSLLGPSDIPNAKLREWSKVYQEYIRGHYKLYVNILVGTHLPTKLQRQRIVLRIENRRKGSSEDDHMRAHGPR